MNQQEFVQKWRTLVTLPHFTEIAYYQQHLIDLCDLVGHPPPAGTETAQQPFRFERRAEKEDGGSGRADVWYQGRFAIGYYHQRQALFTKSPKSESTQA